MRSVLLTSGKTGKFSTITKQIPKLADICRRDKTPCNKVVFEDVGNPLGVAFSGFLISNRFRIFRVSEDNGAGAFQNVVDGNLILPCEIHAHIFAVILSQPNCTVA